jgi:hypothetical protein
VDPTGRHEFRYWTGSHWSSRVDDPTGPSTDPVEPLFHDPFPPPPTPPLRLPLRPPAGDLKRRRRLARPRPAEPSPSGGEPRRLARGWRRPFSKVGMTLLGLLLGALAGGVLVLYVGSRTDPGQEAVADPPDPLVDALSRYVADNALGGVSEQDADCMAHSIIDSIGRSRLYEVGVDLGEDPLTALTPDEVTAALPVAMDCLDDATAEVMIARTLHPTMLARFNVQNPECVAHDWMEQLGRETLLPLYASWAAGIEVADSLTDLTPTQIETLISVLTTCSATPTTTTSP